MSKNQKKCKKETYLLWAQHVIWTRMYILAALNNNNDESSIVLNRLLQNQEDIGNSIKKVAGPENANTLTLLLKEHIAIAGKIVSDVIKNDNSTLNSDIANWFRNADDISYFLGTLGYNESKMKEMLYMHLNLTKDELINRNNKNYTQDIIAFDKILIQAFDMAEAFKS